MPYIYVTSFKAYRLLLEKFPMPYLSLSSKMQQSGVDALKALKTLYEKGSFSCDCILIIVEMHLQKSTQYQSGMYVGVDEE